MVKGGKNLKRQKVDETAPLTASLEQDHEVDKAEETKSRRRRFLIGLIVVIVLCLAVTLIVLLDLLLNTPKHQPLLPLETANWYQKAFQRSVDPAYIKKHVEFFAFQPHIAGSAQDNVTATYVMQQFQAFGLDEVRAEVMPVNLSYPLTRSVRVVYPPNATYDCVLKEAVVNDGTSQNPNAVATWNGYSASGNATGELVYVNYGTADDYAAIDFFNVSLKGKVVIARYGKNYRGDKVSQAVQRGAVAVLIYTDPGDTGPPSGQQSYPNGPWSTNSSVQRGSIWNGNGDPGTPGWPSTINSPRVTLEQAQTPEWSMNEPLPTIPVQPLAWGDAQRMLLGLRGQTRPNDGWAGGFDLQYIGPGPVQVNVAVTVNNTVVPITNVVGFIRGEYEPDRVIVMGAHRDAWTFGAADPISGQSTLLEVARVFGYMHTKQQWRPRRSVMFVSWDAEEYALVGSTEFVELHYRSLAQQAVAYLNLDVGVSGTDRFDAMGSPLMYSTLVNVLQTLALPAPKKGSVFNIWSKELKVLDDGSDYGAWMHYAGISSMHIQFSSNTGVYNSVYHSNYDSIYWMENFGDPGFVYHALLAKVFGTVAMQLSDTILLPFDARRYAFDLTNWVQQLQNSTKQVDFTSLINATRAFNASCFHLVNEMNNISMSALQQRSINDRLMFLDRSFLGPPDLSGDVFYRHILFAPTATNGYSGSVLATIYSALAAGNTTQADYLGRRFALMIENTAEYLQGTFTM